MANPRVKLYYVCRTETGWKRYPAAWGRNGKIRPQYAQVKHTQMYFESGHYECRYWEDGHSLWKNVGSDASIAIAQHIHLGKTLSAQVAAEAAGTEIVETNGRINLKAKSTEYVERQIARGKKRASQTFKTAVEEFLPISKTQFADQLTEAHITRWYAALRAKKNSDRTIYNKHVSIIGWLSWAGVNTKKLAANAPGFTEKEVEVYKAAELKTFFASLTDSYHRIVFEVLLKTGLRMQEAMFLQWMDIDFVGKTLAVRERTEDGFSIKDRAERTVPLANDLVKHLKKWQKEHGGKLVLGTSNDTPNWKWLPLLKRLARDAGLNCNHCRGCKGHQECERWYLHKFRATYTTMLLRALNGDVRTVMKHTGHSDLATVMRYLEAAGLAETQKRINAINWGD